MKRIDHLNDPNAPPANSLIPAVSAIIVNGEGKIVLHRRSDTETWALLGGALEIGESISEAVKREVKEETGLEVEPERIIEYADGEIRQEFSVYFACTMATGDLQVSEESHALGFFTPEEIEQLNIRDSMRLRIKHYLEQKNQPVSS